MTIAVTGATGQLGSRVIHGLLESQDPATIVAVVCDPEKATSFAERGVQVRTAVYGDAAALDAALAGVDTLLLVSGSEVGQRVAQHTSVIEAAKRAGVGRIVYTSAPHARTTALILAPEHKSTEEAIEASGLAFTILRNNWYTENYAAQIGQARATGAIASSVGDGRIASASRGDFAAAAVAVLTGNGHEGKVYELTGDTAWTFDDLASAISEIIGQPVIYNRVTAEEERAHLIAAGVPEGGADFVVALNANIAAGDLADATADLRSLIGRPTTPLVEGLRAVSG